MRKALIVGLLTVVILAAVVFGAWRLVENVTRQFTPEVCTVPLADGGSTTLSAEQARNASIIVAVSIQRGLPERAAVVALATAYQESDIRNLDYGDRDSLGLFQQRPSYGWGTEEQIMDPWYSSGRFYEELVKFPDWEAVGINDMAQKVQRSGFPDAYGQHVGKSEAVAAALRGSGPELLSCLNFEPEPPDAASFLPVLEALGPAVTVAQPDDATLTITAPDESTMWAAAQHVVANSYAGGVTRVVAADREWNPAETGWHDADAAQPALTISVTLG